MDSTQHFYGYGGPGNFCVVSAFGGDNVDGKYCWPTIIEDVEKGGQSMAAMFEAEIPHLWHFVPMYQAALKKHAVGKDHLILITKDDGTTGNVQKVEATYLAACDGRFGQPLLPPVVWLRHCAWRELVESGFGEEAFAMLAKRETTYRVNQHKPGDQLFFVGKSEDFADGDKLTYGQSGTILGPATLASHTGKGLKMKFGGNEGPVDCLLSELSTSQPGPLPGAHKVRGELFFVGQSEDFASGNKLTYGQSGTILGPATLAAHTGKGLKMKFAGNEGPVDCFLDALSTSQPGPLPGAHKVRGELFYVGKSEDFASGNKVTYGERGTVLGPATAASLAGKGLKMKFAGNKGGVDCFLSQLSTSQPST